MNHFFYLFIFILYITGCQSTTLYKQAEDGRFGYSDTKLDEKIYRVNFKGNSITSRETVETYMMYRVAQLTHEEGYEYFKILSRDHKTVTSLDSSYRSNAFSGPYITGYYGFNNYRYPYYGYGYPWAYGFNANFDNRRRYESVAYVKMYDQKPENDETLQQADLVIKFLKDKIKFPEKPAKTKK